VLCSAAESLTAKFAKKTREGRKEKQLEVREKTFQAGGQLTTDDERPTTDD
jgi:hypothetical protein